MLIEAVGSVSFKVWPELRGCRTWSCTHSCGGATHSAAQLAHTPSHPVPLDESRRRCCSQPTWQVRVDSLGLRYLSLGLTSFSLRDMLVGLGLTSASTIDTSNLFTLKDAKALYVPAYSGNSLGAPLHCPRPVGSAALCQHP